MVPGEIVAERFLIEELAASGGMGSVYRALDTRTGLTVALKTIRGEEDVDAIIRFTREAQALARIEGPASSLTSPTAARRGRALPRHGVARRREPRGRGSSARALTVAESVTVALGRIAEALGGGPPARAWSTATSSRATSSSPAATWSGVKLIDFGVARLRRRAAEHHQRPAR